MTAVATITLEQRFDEAVQAGYTAIRADSPLGQIEQALNYISPKLITTDYGPNKFAIPDGIIPWQETTDMIGVNTITRYRITHVGAWQLTSEGRTNRPKADYYLTPVQYKSHYFDDSFSYSSQDLDAQAFASQNYPRMVFDTALLKRQSLELGYIQMINRCFSVGIPEIGIFGLLNHPDCHRIEAPYPISRSATPDQNNFLLNLGAQTIETATNYEYTPNTLLIPKSRERILKNQLFGTSGDVSVLKFYLRENEKMSIEVAPELETAGPGGTPMAVFYERSPEVLEGIVPKPMTQVGGPVQKGTQWEVNFDAAVSGVHISKPNRVLIMTGI